MSIEDITQKVSDRYARAAATGEQMCCPTGYNFDDLRAFIPEEVLKISYGSSMEKMFLMMLPKYLIQT